MTIAIKQSNSGPLVELTTDSPDSCYGLPVLRVDNGSSHDFGPRDWILTADYPHGVIAARVVAERASDWPENSPEWLECQRFCRQWPTGPQVTRKA
jgi:hypothetical protein